MHDPGQGKHGPIGQLPHPVADALDDGSQVPFGHLYRLHRLQHFRHRHVMVHARHLTDTQRVGQPHHAHLGHVPRLLHPHHPLRQQHQHPRGDSRDQVHTAQQRQVRTCSRMSDSNRRVHILLPRLGRPHIQRIHLAGPLGHPVNSNTFLKTSRTVDDPAPAENVGKSRNTPGRPNTGS